MVPLLCSFMHAILASQLLFWLLSIVQFSGCDSGCYSHCLIFTTHYLADAAGLNVCGHFPFSSLSSIPSTVCDLEGHNTLHPPLPPKICFHSRHVRVFASVTAISDPHWKWQVNFAQLLPFSVPLSRAASVPSHSAAAWLQQMNEHALGERRVQPLSQTSSSHHLVLLFPLPRWHVSS